ncbi:hypothetical protein SAMN05216189_101910 [Pseudomonas delhiensis]|uniref:Uncharacterized protein n=1 Tax=Pseudomonas delhiensis TaxID=366289 RepID=A0A239I8E7_9PSED|nr:hypothetical protein SAMN05216189_101910 [Pseudomonas delhiensis]SNS89827.1 hypothetical protein SAMN06295949_109109 [Pseudomonas delhiensis]
MSRFEWLVVAAACLVIACYLVVCLLLPSEYIAPGWLPLR